MQEPLPHVWQMSSALSGIVNVATARGKTTDTATGVAAVADAGADTVDMVVADGVGEMPPLTVMLVAVTVPMPPDPNHGPVASGNGPSAVSQMAWELLEHLPVVSKILNAPLRISRFHAHSVRHKTTFICDKPIPDVRWSVPSHAHGDGLPLVRRVMFPE